MNCWRHVSVWARKGKGKLPEKEEGTLGDSNGKLTGGGRVTALTNDNLWEIYDHENERTEGPKANLTEMQWLLSRKAPESRAEV